MASKSLPPISEEKQLSDQKLSHNASMDVRREFHKMQLNDDRPKQRRIVVAMDSSDEASRSFLYAVREVANQNAHFIDTLLLMRSEHRWGPDTLNSTIEGNKRRVDEATNDLNKFEKVGKRFKVRSEPHVVLCEDKREEIIHFSREMDAALLVMGCRRLNRVQRTFLRSVSNFCVNKSECPVLVVKCRDTPEPIVLDSLDPEAPLATRVVVCALDHTEASRKAFAFYTTNIARKGDKLLLLHTIKKDSHSSAEKANGKNLKNAQYMMKYYENLCSTSGIEYVTYVAVSENKREEIVHFTEKTNASLLVIGCRRLSRVQRTFMKSCSNYCVNKCRCSVLIVR